jgi:hypothetical protein
MLATKLLHKPNRAAMVHLDELLDEALQETFPASDPIAIAVEVDSLEPDTRPRAGVRAVQTRTQGVFGS